MTDLNHQQFLGVLCENTERAHAAFDGRSTCGPIARDVFFSLRLNVRKLERIHYALVAPYAPTSFPNVTPEPRRVLEVEELPDAAFDAFRMRMSYDTPILEAAVAANHLSAVWAWMTLEVLAQDAFVGALDAHPNAARPAWTALAGPRMQEKATEQALHGKVGTILEGKSVSFTRVTSIAEAFAAAFGTPLPDMAADDDLFVLQKARNLVAHRGGTVDQQFLDDTKGRIAGEVGRPVNFTPAVLAPLLNASTTWALRLLHIVDEWELRVDPGCAVTLSPFP